MGTLGKILLFVNLLAAAGVAYFATVDYAKRQDVTATALRYHLVLAGIPVESASDKPIAADASEVPFVTDLPDGTKTETVSPKLLQNYFTGAEGGTQFGAAADAITSSQIAEVDRVEKKLAAHLDTLPPADQLAHLCGRAVIDPATRRPVLSPQFPAILVRLADTYDEREFLRLLGTPVDQSKVQVNLATARQILDKKFAAVKARPDPKAAESEAVALKEAVDVLRVAGDRATQANAALIANPDDEAAKQRADTTRVALINADVKLKQVLTDFGTAAARDDGDRKKRIALLLMHVDPTAAWQKRVGLVVGLRTYSNVLGEHVNRLRDMAMSAQQQKVLDQAKFSEEYELIKTLAVQQSLLLDRQTAITADYAAQWAQDSAALKKRHGQLLQREDALVSIKAQVNEALAKQATAEADLFAVQKAVGETLRKNFELEDQLDAAEQKAGAPK